MVKRVGSFRTTIVLLFFIALAVLALNTLVAFLSRQQNTQSHASTPAITLLTLNQLNASKPYHILGSLLVDYAGSHLPNPVQVSGTLLATGTLEIFSDNYNTYESDVLQIGDKGAIAFVEQTRPLGQSAHYYTIGQEVRVTGWFDAVHTCGAPSSDKACTLFGVKTYRKVPNLSVEPGGSVETVPN